MVAFVIARRRATTNAQGWDIDSRAHVRTGRQAGVEHRRRLAEAGAPDRGSRRP
jgi:hypothetical protein